MFTIHKKPPSVGGGDFASMPSSFQVSSLDDSNDLIYDPEICHFQFLANIVQTTAVEGYYLCGGGGHKIDICTSKMQVEKLQGRKLKLSR